MVSCCTTLFQGEQRSCQYQLYLLKEIKLFIFKLRTKYKGIHLKKAWQRPNFLDRNIMIVSFIDIIVICVQQIPVNMYFLKSKITPCELMMCLWQYNLNGGSYIVTYSYILKSKKVLNKVFRTFLDLRPTVTRRHEHLC